MWKEDTYDKGEYEGEDVKEKGGYEGDRRL
jgi:hypothetical protein